MAEFRDMLHVALFGLGMEKVQTDGSVLRQTVNRWLADALDDRIEIKLAYLIQRIGTEYQR